MAIEWKTALAGFMDGYTASVLMFKKVIRVPGSPAEDLIRSTTPKLLAEYGAIDPTLPDMLVKLRDDVLRWDRIYARAVRVIGCLELAALAAAACFLILHTGF